MIIHVKDTFPPRVRQCPKSFTEYLLPDQRSKRVSWREPIFQDNVKIQHVMASYLPGHHFTAGRPTEDPRLTTLPAYQDESLASELAPERPERVAPAHVRRTSGRGDPDLVASTRTPTGGSASGSR